MYHFSSTSFPKKAHTVLAGSRTFFTECYPTMFLMILISPKSIKPRKKEITKTRPMTTAVEARSSLRVGHFTFLSSVLDSRKNWRADRTISGNRHPVVRLLFAVSSGGHGRHFFLHLPLGPAVFFRRRCRLSHRGIGQSSSHPFPFLSFFHCPRTVTVLDSTPSDLAGQEGFEPPSPGFGVRCSSR